MNNDDKLREAIRAYEAAVDEWKAAVDALKRAEGLVENATEELIRVIRSLGLAGKVIIVDKFQYRLMLMENDECLDSARLVIESFEGKVLNP